MPNWFITRCEHCGWQGSTEFCGEINYGDDADVTCAGCHRIFMTDEIVTTYPHQFDAHVLTYLDDLISRAEAASVAHVFGTYY